MDALRFPDHFPPKDKWNKFFIGVRWLGPDLSFFKDLKKIQAARTSTRSAEWGGGARQELAEAISRILARQLGWKSQVFLPQDSAAVAFHGPRFDFVDSDSAFEEVVETLELDFRIKVPSEFWQEEDKATFGELVDELLSHRGA